MTTQALRQEALAIWRAGVDAVRTDRLIDDRVQLDQNCLQITACNGATHNIDLTPYRRVCIVGAGKAAAGLAVKVAERLSPRFAGPDELFGWINVPAGATLPAAQMTIHACRPIGSNEPTAAAVAGTQTILEMVASLCEDDLCIVVLTGGGSALLPAPAAGISLEDKLAVTRFLSAAGADIRQLNSVRRQLSRVKGGRLAKACGAGQLVCLIVSDVLDDSLAIIASGPTVPSDDRQAALDVLQQFDPQRKHVAKHIWATVRRSQPVDARCLPRTLNVILANNQSAVDAAATAARQRGYMVEAAPLESPQPTADELGLRIADEWQRLRKRREKVALIGGGEPTVTLAPTEQRGRGGRNQQAALAAVHQLLNADLPAEQMHDTVLLSAGTDGEDGPTDAAGALVGTEQLRLLTNRQQDVLDALHRNDAYSLLEEVHGLLRTGPTHTNVCDLWVLLHNPSA